MISAATSQRKQEDILQAATQLFLEHGYGGVTLDAIVERVGGSKTTVYSYFGGKDGLFVATLRRISDQLLKPLLDLKVTEMEPESGLRALGTEFLRALLSPCGRSVFLTMISEARRFPELGNHCFKFGPGACIRVVGENIRHWQSRGLLREGDPEVMAEQYLGGMLGPTYIALLLGVSQCSSTKTIDKRVADRTRLFLQGARVWR